MLRLLVGMDVQKFHVEAYVSAIPYELEFSGIQLLVVTIYLFYTTYVTFLSQHSVFITSKQATNRTNFVQSLILLGAGGVGSVFLSLLAKLTTSYPQLNTVLISRSTKCLYATSFTRPLSLSTWSTDLSASDQPVLNPTEIITYLSKAPGNSILVDNTSSLSIADTYPAFLRAGISIVTPNKKAFSGSYDLWTSIFSAAYNPTRTPNGGLIYHESSVGAGLPVICTLKDLVETGDTVHRIEGVFSGTLSFLFNNFAPLSAAEDGSKKKKWSVEVRKAKEMGYTEPDPRDDLNGLDVARKLVILARLAGLAIPSTSSFPVQCLIPAALENVSSGEEFLARLEEFDDEMDEVKGNAEREGKVIRYVGSIDMGKGKVKVGMERLEKSHPIAGLKGSDNIISFYTERYGDRPLIVQGAG